MRDKTINFPLEMLISNKTIEFLLEELIFQSCLTRTHSLEDAREKYNLALDNVATSLKGYLGSLPETQPNGVPSQV